MGRKKKFRLDNMTAQEKRLKKMQIVFNKERRKINFQIADELLAMKQISLPGIGMSIYSRTGGRVETKKRIFMG